MAIALNLSKRPYVLESDKQLDPEHQTTFYIKPLSARQSALIQDNMKLHRSGDGASMENLGTQTLEILKFGLAGWDNFKDEAGNEIKFSDNAEDNINRLALEYRFELSGAIMQLSNLGTEREKN